MHAYDIYGDAVIWKRTGYTEGGVNVAVTDIDPLRIVFTTQRHVYIYAAADGDEPFVETHSYASPRDIIDTAIGDMDGDGALEVLVLSEGEFDWRTGMTPNFVSRLDEELNLLNTFALDVECTAISVEDLGVGQRNVLVATYDRFSWESTIAAYDPDSGVQIWTSPALLSSVGRNSLHYVDMGGKTRAAFGTERAMYLTR